MVFVKSLYGTFGASYPISSLVFFILLGATCGFGFWKFAEYSYQQDSKSTLNNEYSSVKEAASDTGSGNAAINIRNSEDVIIEWNSFKGYKTIVNADNVKGLKAKNNVSHQ